MGTEKQNDSDDQCPECGGAGHINFFFKNPSQKSVRADFLNCSTCFPDQGGFVGVKVGEEEIDKEEAFRLMYEEGWQEE
jgi:hypothetical protein